MEEQKQIDDLEELCEVREDDREAAVTMIRKLIKSLGFDQLYLHAGNRQQMKDGVGSRVVIFSGGPEFVLSSIHALFRDNLKLSEEVIDGLIGTILIASITNTMKGGGTDDRDHRGLDGKRERDQA